MELFTLQQLVSKAKADVVEFDVTKAAKAINDGLILVDVREPGEYSQGHIDGAINVPRGVLEFKTDPDLPNSIPALYNKSAFFMVYCRTGARSAFSAQVLGLLGYKTVVSMAGGIEAWKEQGLPVVIG